MADTHINAYFADVDAAEQKALAAHAEWDAAKERLEIKKKEVGYVETSPSESKIEETKPEKTKPEKTKTHQTSKKK